MFLACLAAYMTALSSELSARRIKPYLKQTSVSFRKHGSVFFALNVKPRHHTTGCADHESLKPHPPWSKLVL